MKNCINVLTVSEDVNWLCNIAEYFSKMNFYFESNFLSAQEALRLAEREKFDLVVAGPRSVSAVSKAIEKNPKAKVIFTTHDEILLREQLEKWAILEKEVKILKRPFPLKFLEDAIEVALR